MILRFLLSERETALEDPFQQHLFIFLRLGEKGRPNWPCLSQGEERAGPYLSKEGKTAASCAALPCRCLVSAWVPPLGSSPWAEIFSPWFLAITCVCFLPCFVTASGQENESGYEENLLAVEGSGPGGDQHCCAVQLPGTCIVGLCCVWVRLEGCKDWTE